MRITKVWVIPLFSHKILFGAKITKWVFPPLAHSKCSGFKIWCVQMVEKWKLWGFSGSTVCHVIILSGIAFHWRVSVDEFYVYIYLYLLVGLTFTVVSVSIYWLFILCTKLTVCMVFLIKWLSHQSCLGKMVKHIADFNKNKIASFCLVLTWLNSFYVNSVWQLNMSDKIC